MDSFDESGVKSNLIIWYLYYLGNKENDKVIICCRSNHFPKNDLIEYFIPRNKKGLIMGHIRMIDY